MTPELPRVLDAVALDRYLAGACSDTEHAAVVEWLAADPARSATIRALRNALSGGVGHGRVDVDAEWRRLSAAWDQSTAVDVSLPRRYSEEKRTTLHNVVKTLWFAAAALVIGTVGLAIGWRTTPPMAGRQQAMHPGSAATYATANGQRANITLPDGSVVTLNVASQLEVPADYAAGNRVLRLSGEALFTVHHRSGIPFTVIAGGTTARVLGTTFAVRHYATDSTTIVAVRDGKVGVRSAVLTAAQLAELWPAGTLRLVVATPSRFGFASGVLTLNDVPFAAAVVELDRWYDADIRLADSSLAKQRVTGEYGSGSLAELADILAGTFNVRVVRHGRVVTLYPR